MNFRLPKEEIYYKTITVLCGVIGAIVDAEKMQQKPIKCTS